MTSGENRLAERLEKKLEDDYLLWYDVPVGPKQLKPDFVVLHPGRGFLVLEVKDWKLDTIQEADRASVTLLTDRGLVRGKNPLLQAKVYALEVATALQRDRALIYPQSHRYFGKLLMPYGWGAVLTNITRTQFESTNLGEVINPDLTVCKDEMLESVDPFEFQQRLWRMFNVVFPCALSLPQIDRVRWHLFPEIRVAPESNQMGMFDGADARDAIPDVIRVMDMQQELLARSMGDGHRVIHGVAGSGKTMILGYRSLYLAQALSKPVLVLCYNVTLAARLRALIESRDASHRVAVRSFHAWCREMLVAYHVDLPVKGDGFFEKLVSSVIGGVERGQIPRAQYGAVLVDEGHDFQPDWFKLIVQMVDPTTSSLLVLYDDAQAIYEKVSSSKFSFASVGIQAKGRTTILKLNYRNTLEVLSVAKAFAKELLLTQSADDDGVPVIAPESAGRRGPVPELIRCDSAWDEANLIAARISDELGHGRAPSDIAVVYRSENVAADIGTALERNGIAYRVARGTEGKRALFDGDPAVKLVSMHSSKGLEFGAVFIPGLGSMPRTVDAETEESRLLYVAMTRATERLALIYHKESVFVERIRVAINDVQATLAVAS